MTRTIYIAAALALAVTLPAVPAQAQSPRTFVSAAGNDINPCSFAAPCRHFQAAVNATTVGGEVDALDPAGYGPITISQAITIEGQGWSYIAPPAGGNGITINAVSGNVTIHGVSLNGAGITGGTNGIVFNSGGSLTVADSVVRNFGNSGVIVEPSAGNISLLISNSSFLDNANAGIYLTPRQGQVAATIDRVTADVNNYGIYIDASATNSFATASITNSIVSNNLNTGITVIGTSFTQAEAYVKESTLSNNPTGISVSGCLGLTFLSHSMIQGSSIAGINKEDCATANSAGYNDIINNTVPVNGGSLGSNPEQ